MGRRRRTGQKTQLKTVILFPQISRIYVYVMIPDCFSPWLLLCTPLFASKTEAFFVDAQSPDPFKYLRFVFFHFKVIRFLKFILVIRLKTTQLCSSSGIYNHSPSKGLSGNDEFSASRSRSHSELVVSVSFPKKKTIKPQKSCFLRFARFLAENSNFLTLNVVFL